MLVAHHNKSNNDNKITTTEYHRVQMTTLWKSQSLWPAPSPHSGGDSMMLRWWPDFTPTFALAPAKRYWRPPWTFLRQVFWCKLNQIDVLFDFLILLRIFLEYLWYFLQLSWDLMRFLLVSKLLLALQPEGLKANSRIEYATPNPKFHWHIQYGS